MTVDPTSPRRFGGPASTPFKVLVYHLATNTWEPPTADDFKGGHLHSGPCPNVFSNEEMKARRFASDLRWLGFTPADPLEYSDKPCAYVTYLGRAHSGDVTDDKGKTTHVTNHQRVSLVTHPTSGRGEFLQAVVQVYDKAPSIGRPKGKPPTFLHASEPRCWEDLLAAVTRVYPLPKP